MRGMRRGHDHRQRRQLTKREEVLTEFYECTGCTVTFRHPARFTRLGMPVRRWAADVEPRTLREVHRLAEERSHRDDKQ